MEKGAVRQGVNKDTPVFGSWEQFGSGQMGGTESTGVGIKI